MFGIDSSELLVIALIALVVIGPKDLPRVMRTIGNWVGRARGMAGHFRAGVDNMIRESELADMEKKWKAENERIMREHPAALPAPAPAGEEKWPEPVADELPPPPKRLAASGKASARPKAPPARGAPARRAAPPIPRPRPAPGADDAP
jgi:sec-independent protein translocase protein TatB